jgi:hypothetical protein
LVPFPFLLALVLLALPLADYCAVKGSQGLMLHLHLVSFASILPLWTPSGVAKPLCFPTVVVGFCFVARNKIILVSDYGNRGATCFCRRSSCTQLTVLLSPHTVLVWVACGRVQGVMLWVACPFASDPAAVLRSLSTSSAGTGTVPSFDALSQVLGLHSFHHSTRPVCDPLITPLCVMVAGPDFLWEIGSSLPVTGICVELELY